MPTAGNEKYIQSKKEKPDKNVEKSTIQSGFFVFEL